MRIWVIGILLALVLVIYLSMYPSGMESPKEEKAPAEDKNIILEEKGKEVNKFSSSEKKEVSEEFISMLDSIVNAEKVSSGCFLVKYPEFNVYVFWEPCEAPYSEAFEHYGVNFAFEDERVREYVSKMSQKEVDKLKSRLEKMNYGIFLFVSEDGENWEEKGVLVEHATVPDVVVGYDGKIRVYFVSFPQNIIKVAVSGDGEKWEIFDLKGVEPGMVDPEIVLKNGKYYLYTPWGSLYIAVSKDGFAFEVLEDTGISVMDPTVFKIGEDWYMVAGPGLVVYREEEKFEKIRKIESDAEVCDSFMQKGTLYCHKISKKGSLIVKLETEDGKEWKEKEVLKSESFLADPSVAYFKGKYFMAVTKLLQEK